ncbi:hypothetical protein [Chryseolinea lacunae]|uniref:Outer membrane protein beta-barrel domain-containing protein n=1 Tax=Chryseolinea lacunae TaxID=2801331 RepID=A0ABS1KN84_9BACT|nr:hypothetical protein [Chryseolinea lacunae]MBL0740683.1 hypothetical protein [Chryseolinea lacunae]
MKKTLRFFLAFVVLAHIVLQASAQDESSFGAFYALPVGSFGSTDVKEGGFAKPGWGFVFDSRSTYKFLPKGMSLYFHSTYQWNTMDTEKVAEAFTQALGRRTVTSSSRYSPLLTTIGPAYTFDLGQKVKLGVNTSVGIMFNNTRAFSLQVYDDNNNELLRETINFNNNVAFAYTAGFELKFPILENVLSGAIYADYTGAKQKTELTFDTLDPISSFQKIRYLNLGFKLIVPKKKAE